MVKLSQHLRLRLSYSRHSASFWAMCFPEHPFLWLGQTLSIYFIVGIVTIAAAYTVLVFTPSHSSPPPQPPITPLPRDSGALGIDPDKVSQRLIPIASGDRPSNGADVPQQIGAFRATIATVASSYQTLAAYAAQGDANAQYRLGALFEQDLGVKPDYVRARQWYEKAASQGEANAQYRLGVLYDQGLGVEPDYVRAREWYEKAAAQGNANAEYGLGALYDQGLGVNPDYVRAREWYEKAAAQGVANAQYRLAELYDHGLGGPRDEEQARTLWEKAAADVGSLSVRPGAS